MDGVGVDSRRTADVPDALAVALAEAGLMVSDARGGLPADAAPVAAAPETTSAPVVLHWPTGVDRSAIRRLIVPASGSDLDDAEFGRRLWGIVQPTDVAVLLLGRVDGTNDELRMRRRLTLLAAFLRRPHGSVETHVAFDRTWIGAVRRVQAPGDAVLCPSEGQAGRRSGPSFAQRVMDRLRLPVCMVDGLDWPVRDRPRLRWSEIAAWLAPLALLTAFGLVQSQVVIRTGGWIQTTVLTITVVTELGALWLVESLIGLWR
jgi:hypothetical protein